MQHPATARSSLARAGGGFSALVDQLRNHLLVAKATIRDYEPGDLGRVLDLWGRADESGEAGGLTLDQAVDLMSSGPSATVVAEIEGDIVGSVIGSSSAAIGWVHRLTVLPGLSEEMAIADGLLARIEQLLAGRGARRLGALVTEGERSRKHLERWDYRPSDIGCLEPEDQPGSLERAEGPRGRQADHRAPGDSAARGAGARLAALGRATARHRPLRSAWDRQDDVRQGHRLAARLALRGNPAQ